MKKYYNQDIFRNKQATVRVIAHFLFPLLFLGVVFSVPVSAQTSSVQSANLSAQTQNGEPDEIDLPDVATSVAGSSPETEASAVPDFTTVLPEQQSPLPVLPSVLIADVDALGTGIIGSEAFGSTGIFLEGLVGAGLPGYFVGDFSVYQPGNENPFEINFSHESLNGYGLNRPENGYSNSTTSLQGSVNIAVTDAVTTDTGAEYRTSSYGLQGKSPLFYSTSQQMFEVNSSLDWSLPYSIMIGALLDASWFNQYSVVTGTVPDDCITSWTLLSATPGLYGTWEYGPFSVRTSGSYSFHMLTIPEQTFQHRGEIGTDVAWSVEPDRRISPFSAIRLDGSAGAVFSTDAGFVVPFSLSGSVDMINVHTDAVATVSYATGIRSEETDVTAIQAEYPYVDGASIPVEETEKFADFTMRLPVENWCIAEVVVSYGESMFGNGSLKPDFSAVDPVSGFFTLPRADRFHVTVDSNISFQVGIVGAVIGCTGLVGNDNPSVPEYGFYLKLSTYPSDGVWGMDAGVEWNPDDDLVPDVELSAYLRVNNAFRIVVEVTDLVKLVTGTDRVLHAPYVVRGGTASVMAKLFF